MPHGRTGGGRVERDQGAWQEAAPRAPNEPRRPLHMDDVLYIHNDKTIVYFNQAARSSGQGPQACLLRPRPRRPGSPSAESVAAALAERGSA